MRQLPRTVVPGGKDVLTEEPLLVACWCENQEVRIPRTEIGKRTRPCRLLRCRAMNDEYERRL